MDDDLDTQRAIAALRDLASRIGQASRRGAGTATAQRALRELADVLGLTLEERPPFAGRVSVGPN